VLALQSSGYTPVVVDNFSTGNRDIAKLLGVDLVECNAGDKTKLDPVFSRYNPIAVMHFAAFALVGESVTDPGKYYQNNFCETESLLQTMRKHGCKNFIFSSTCATYGVPKEVPISENCPQSPINPYGWSKLFVERMLSDYDRAYGIKSVAFRYFNAAGADPDSKIGERHDPETHLIPNVIAAAYGKRSLSIFGNDYPTPDGTCVRDYIHVCDLASAHLLGLEYLLNGNQSDVFNIGTGNGLSVLEIIREVQSVTQKEVKYSVESRRAGDPAMLVAAATKIRSVLGWTPKFSDIKTVVETANRWHKKDFAR